MAQGVGLRGLAADDVAGAPDSLGRPQAKIWIGKPEGQSFAATGAIVNEPEAQAALLETYARKYPDGWKKWEESFRTGFADGSRVLIRYTPD